MNFFLKASSLPLITTITILLIQSLNQKFGNQNYIPWFWLIIIFFPLLFFFLVRRKKKTINLSIYIKILLVLYFISIPLFIISLPIVLDHSNLSLIDSYKSSLPFFIIFQLSIIIFSLFKHSSFDLDKSKIINSNTLEEGAKEKIRTLIRNNKFNQAFELLFELIKGKDNLNHLTILQYKWKKNEKDKSMNIIPKEEADLNTSRIIKSILDFIN